MKNLDEVALVIESEGYLENCYSIKCDRKAVAELLVEYGSEIVIANLKEVYSREWVQKDDDLLVAIRRVLRHFMTLQGYEEWINEIGEKP